MNKADEKKLHADPRYKAIRAAHKALMVMLANLDQQAAAAIHAYAQATGRPTPVVPSLREKLALDEAALFERLRPRGDRVRLLTWMYGNAGERPRDGDFELVSVTAKRATVHGLEFRLDTGKAVLRNERVRIHPDDLARIQSGELKGWRQKAWGS